MSLSLQYMHVVSNVEGNGITDIRTEQLLSVVYCSTLLSDALGYMFPHRYQSFLLTIQLLHLFFIVFSIVIIRSTSRKRVVYSLEHGIPQG